MHTISNAPSRRTVDGTCIISRSRWQRSSLNLGPHVLECSHQQSFGVNPHLSSRVGIRLNWVGKIRRSSRTE